MFLLFLRSDEPGVLSQECEKFVSFPGGKLMLSLMKEDIVDYVCTHYSKVAVSLECDDSVPKVSVKFRGNQSDINLAVNWAKKRRSRFSWTDHSFSREETCCLRSCISRNILDLEQLGKDVGVACDMSRLSEGILSVAAISPADPRAFWTAVDQYLGDHLSVTAEQFLTDMQLRFLKRLRFNMPWLGFGQVMSTGIKLLSPNEEKKCLIVKGTRRDVQIALKELEKVFSRFEKTSFDFSYPKGSRGALSREFNNVQEKLTKNDVLVFTSTAMAKDNAFQVTLASFGDLTSARGTLLALSKSFHKFQKTIRVPSGLRSIVFEQAQERNLPIGLVDENFVIYGSSSEAVATSLKAVYELSRKARRERISRERETPDDHRGDCNLMSSNSSEKPSPAKPSYGRKICPTDEEANRRPLVSGITNPSDKRNVGGESSLAISISSNTSRRTTAHLESENPTAAEVLSTKTVTLRLHQKQAPTLDASPSPVTGELKRCATRKSELPTSRKQETEFQPTSPRLLKDIPFSGSKFLSIYRGSVVCECVDVIVTATRGDLLLQTDIAAAGGPSIEKECSKYVNDHGYVASGNTIATDSGNLKCKRILHAVVAALDTQADLRACLRRCFDDVEAMSARSIALPLLFDDRNLPIETGFAVMVEEIKCRLEGGSCVKVVRLVDSNPGLISITGAGPSSSQSSATPLKNFEWRFLDDSNKFQPVDAIVNAKLEKCYAEAKKKNEMQIQVSPYVYDLHFETQKNFVMERVRPIRRCAVNLPGPTARAEWYFVDDVGQQQTYDVASSFRLDSAFDRSAQWVVISIGRFSYEIDLVAMTQKNTTTGKKRYIVRTGLAESSLRPNLIIRPPRKEAKERGFSPFFRKIFSTSETKSFRISSDTGVALSGAIREAAERCDVEINFVTDAGSDSAEVQLKGIKSYVQSAYETIQVSFSRFFDVILLYVLIHIAFFPRIR